MVTTKQLNIKSRTYYFSDDLIDIKNLPKLLKLDKKSFNDISMHYIRYVTKKLNTILIV